MINNLMDKIAMKNIPMKNCCCCFDEKPTGYFTRNISTVSGMRRRVSRRFILPMCDSCKQKAQLRSLFLTIAVLGGLLLSLITIGWILRLIDDNNMPVTPLGGSSVVIAGVIFGMGVTSAIFMSVFGEDYVEARLTPNRTLKVYFKNPEYQAIYEEANRLPKGAS